MQAHSYKRLGRGEKSAAKTFAQSDLSFWGLKLEVMTS